MRVLSSVSDSDLLSRMRGLVLAERAATADVIEHLMEIDRRKLYLDQACSSLYRYCMERLGYSEDEALRRVRVARLARKLPRVLKELRSGAVHLTGLFLLSGYLTEQNAQALLAEARGQSRREIEKLLARWFPQPDTGTRIQPILELSLLGPGIGSRGGHPTASFPAIAPHHSGTGGAAGSSSSTTCPATGQRPVDTCPEQGSSLQEPTRPATGQRPVDTCPEQGNSLQEPTCPATGQRPVDTCPEQGNSLQEPTCPATGQRPVDTCPEQGNSLRESTRSATGKRPVDTRSEQGSSLGRTQISSVDTRSEQGSLLGGMQNRTMIVPLSALSYRVEFTASAELFAKLERATELISHAVPRGELPTVIERALDALIEREMRRRVGTGKLRKQRPLKPGSRHVPREVARLVWERDSGQCTFVDAEGRRCNERRYRTLEHRHPFALGGPPTPDNICLLCGRHNAQSAWQVFGKEHLEKKRSERRISAEAKPKPTLASAPALASGPTPSTERAHPPQTALTDRQTTSPAPTPLTNPISPSTLSSRPRPRSQPTP